MSKFLKLTGTIINTSNINMIYIRPNKYYILLKDQNMTGLTMLGSELISSKYDHIEVCEIKHTRDYKLVSNWINMIR